MRNRLALTIPLLAAMSMWAQMASYSYSGSSSIRLISNFTDCATVNCWHASMLLATQIYSTNGKTYAIDTTNTGYLYTDYPSNTWTAHPEWGQVYALQYAGNGNLYALFGAGGGTCVNQGGAFYRTLDRLRLANRQLLLHRILGRRRRGWTDDRDRHQRSRVDVSELRIVRVVQAVNSIRDLYIFGVN